MKPYAACGTGWGSLSNSGVQVTGQVGSHTVHSSVGPYQFKVISESLFTLCLPFILNLGREEENVVYWTPLRPQYKSQEYIYLLN